MRAAPANTRSIHTSCPITHLQSGPYVIDLARLNFAEKAAHKHMFFGTRPAVQLSGTYDFLVRFYWLRLATSCLPSDLAPEALIVYSRRVWIALA